ncbi:MAG: hypothetical protein Q4D96_03970 [Propionibacteriaceae bacterium]|nr:hypothetical protein [Propionibacteriaceae bacterium]
MFDLQSQALFREVPGRVVLHSFSPDGGLLVVHDDDRARIVDLGTGEAVDLPGEGCNWEEALWHQSGCLMLPAEKPTVPVLAAFRDGDDAVVILDSSETIRLQDRSGQPLGEFGVAGAEALLRLSPQGDRVALRCGEALQVWELTGRFVAGLVHDPYPYDAAWSPDGSHIISAGRDGSIRVWDATTGEVLHTLPGGQSYGRVKVAWSPGGAEVLAGPVGEAGGSIQLWDATCGTPVRSLAGAETTHELRWSSDGALILGSQADGDSGLRWDASTGQLLPPLVVHDPDGGFEDGFDTPWLAIWNPTGTRLATAWDDCLIRLWTPDSPEPLHVLDGHLNPVTHLAWNAAGTRLLSVSDDAVRLWDVASLGEDS